MLTSFLDAKGVKYDYVDVYKDPAAKQYLESIGAALLPVVVNGDTLIKGLDMPKIMEVVNGIN